MTIHIPIQTTLALASAMLVETTPVALLRNAAIDAIEELIAFLDNTEADCDLEPWLAGFDNSTDDREGADDGGSWYGGESDGDCDSEPAGDELDSSWPEGYRGVNFGAPEEDGEDDGCEEEDDPLEPMFGRPDFLINQDRSMKGWTSSDECELTDEDGGDINDEPQDDNELDGCEASDWACVGSMMTDADKSGVRKETTRLLRGLRLVKV